MNMWKAIKTHGRYGAVNTRTPRKLRRVSGFLRDQMYTRVLDSADPRNGMEVVRELRASSDVHAYSSNHEKTAGEGPEPCSSSREYLWRKKT
jgi:hypothetical protein